MAGMMKKIFDMINPSEEYEEEEEIEQSVPNDESSDLSESAKRARKKVLNIYKDDKILSISCFKPVDYDSELSNIADSLISGKVCNSFSNCSGYMFSTSETKFLFCLPT